MDVSSPFLLVQERLTFCALNSTNTLRNVLTMWLETDSSESLVFIRSWVGVCFSTSRSLTATPMNMNATKKL